MTRTASFVTLLHAIADIHEQFSCADGCQLLKLGACFAPAEPAADPSQLELDLQWPAVSQREPLGVVPPEDIATTGRLLVGVLEVMNRRRPLVQLKPQLEPRVYSALDTRMRYGSLPDEPARLASLHTFRPKPNAIEAAGRLERGERAGAFAARLQRDRPGWLLTVLNVIEPRTA